MTWREQWPGEPHETAFDEATEEDSGTFTIALKPSACEAAPEIAALREESGELLTYESEGEAARTLIDDVDCPDFNSKQQRRTTPRRWTHIW